MSGDLRASFRRGRRKNGERVKFIKTGKQKSERGKNRRKEETKDGSSTKTLGRRVLKTPVTA